MEIHILDSCASSRTRMETPGHFGHLGHMLRTTLFHNMYIVTWTFWTGSVQTSFAVVWHFCQKRLILPVLAKLA